MQQDTDQTPASRPEHESTPTPVRPGLARSPSRVTPRISLSPQEAAKTLERLRQLCVTKGEQLQELESAAKALRDSGYKQELSQVLREAITWPESHPRVGALWVRRLVSSNNWDRTYPKAMDELCDHGEIGYCAVIEFLESVSTKGRRNLVREAVRNHSKW